MRDSNSSVKCHQCKKVASDHHGAQCHVCNTRYCDDCVYHRYSDSFYDVLRVRTQVLLLYGASSAHCRVQDAMWECYRCRSKCNCPFCRQRLRFQPHDMFHERAIEYVKEELLGQEDWQTPTMLIEGIGVEKLNANDVSALFLTLGNLIVVIAARIFWRRRAFSRAIARLSSLAASIC